ncbi:peptidoglycan-binding protein [Roseovarius salinarum]|uniref:peptidoglycan-binding protein n=1 Tax=Roseovarius salinarum TaxID=1981892 RepID=UPI0012FFE070|nr:peptidoglycan-binding protein [Roseovarius salinarum]
MRCWVSVILVLLALPAVPAHAAPVAAEVAAVEGDTVTLALPAGAQVDPGAKVTISGEIPGIGPVAISGEWRVIQGGTGRVRARQVGEVSSPPQVGYRATIENGTARAPAPQAPPEEEETPVPAPDAATPPGDAAPDPALVRKAERYLVERGYIVGKIDGTPGPRTRAAIREFQQSSGLTVDGRITPELVDRLKRMFTASGRMRHATLGVMVRNPSREQALAAGADSKTGVLVERVLDDSAASRAGMRRGDLIVSLGARGIVDATKLRLVVLRLAPLYPQEWRTTPFTLYRDGRKVEGRVRLHPD